MASDKAKRPGPKKAQTAAKKKSNAKTKTPVKPKSKPKAKTPVKPKAKTPVKPKPIAKRAAPTMRGPTKQAAPRQMHSAFAPVADAFAGRGDVTAGFLMASFGLKTRQKLFAMHWRGQLVVKLPEARVDALVAARTGTRFNPRGGRGMKEWIAIAEGAGDWVALAHEAHRFVAAGA